MMKVWFVHDACELRRQDVLLPMAISKKFPGDTLFFIFEQDFEFHPDREWEATREEHPQEQGSSSTSSGSLLDH